jgi:hypothetical protein
MSSLIEIEKELMDLEQLDLKVDHIFQDGVYYRKLYIPAGTLLVGKRHRHATMNILAKGKMTIYDEFESFECEAGFTSVSDPLTKKAGYAHEDSIWINAHKTDETDVDKIEEEFIMDEKEYISLKELECHGQW